MQCKSLVLKSLNLNYIKPHFRPILLVRKKFVKSYQPECFTPVTSDCDQKDDTKKLETDLKQAQKKVNGLLTDIAQQNYLLEEFEVKMNAMEKIKAELELKLDKSDEKSESLKKELTNALETTEEITKGQKKS